MNLSPAPLSWLKPLIFSSLHPAQVSPELLTATPERPVRAKHLAGEVPERAKQGGGAIDKAKTKQVGGKAETWQRLSGLPKMMNQELGLGNISIVCFDLADVCFCWV